MNKQELMRQLLDLYQQYEAYPNSIVELYIQKLELMLIKDLDKNSLYIDVNSTFEKIIKARESGQLKIDAKDLGILYSCGCLTEEEVIIIIKECKFENNANVVTLIEAFKLLPINAIRTYYNKIKNHLPPECKNNIKIMIKGDE